MHGLTVILFRWLHVFSSCVAIGGVFVLRLLVAPALRGLDEPARTETMLRIRRKFKMVVHPCILFLLVSGVYNTLGNWNVYNQIPERAHPLWGIHVLLGVSIMAIALWVLAGKEPPKSHMKWMLVNLLLMAAAVGAAAALKYVRDTRPVHPTVNTNSTSTAAPSGRAFTPTAARAWRPDSPMIC